MLPPRPEPVPLRQRLHGGEPLIGIFSRLVAPEAIEMLARSALDLIVLDAEHGSFDRASLSAGVQAARASNLPVLVRPVDASRPAIQHAIASGADGLQVPHLSSAEETAELVQFARGLAVERAWGGGARATGHRTTPWPEFRDRMARELVVIAQIDEPPGLAAASAIARVPGVDLVFVGRIGLSLAMGAPSPADPGVARIIEGACQACREAGVPMGMQLSEAEQARDWAAQGVRLFLMDSDYSLLLREANRRTGEFRAALG